LKILYFWRFVNVSFDSLWWPCGPLEDDLRGQDRPDRTRAFERHLPIKEIMRTLSVSRATLGKVIRGKASGLKYERGVQPAPKLGEWVDVLTGILEQEAKLPGRGRRCRRLCR
jgi:hypothetical protein